MGVFLVSSHRCLKKTGVLEALSDIPSCSALGLMGFECYPDLEAAIGAKVSKLNNSLQGHQSGENAVSETFGYYHDFWEVKKMPSGDMAIP